MIVERARDELKCTACKLSSLVSVTLGEVTLHLCFNHADELATELAYIVNEDNDDGN